MVEVPLSKRAFSIFIVTLMLMSSFAGVSWFVGDTGVNAQTYEGCMEVDGHETWSGTTIVSQSLVIGEGDTLEIIDGALLFKQLNMTGQFSYLVIEDGGQLILRDSSLAPLLYIGSDVPCLGVVVRDGGSLVMEGSEATFAGHMLFDDATLVMNDSSISGLDQDLIAQYCDGITYPADFFSDAPVITFVSSTVSIDDSRIEDTFSNSTTGTSGMHACHYPFASDSGPGTTVTYSLERDVSSVSPYDDTVGNDISATQRQDGVYYTVQPGTTMSFDATDMLGTLFSEADPVSVVAHATYRAPYGFHDDTDEVEVTLAVSPNPMVTLSPINDTSYGYDTTQMEVREVEETLPSISSIDMATVNVTFENTDTTEYVEFDHLWFEVEMSLFDAYRNINVLGDSRVTVIDSYLDVDNDYWPYSHNALSLYDTSEAYLYGVEFDMNATTIPYMPAIETHQRDLLAYPDAYGSNDNGTSIPMVNFRGTGVTYTQDRVMEIASFNVGDLDHAVEDAELTIESTGNSGYASTNYVQWALAGQPYANTSIMPTQGDTVQTNEATGVDITNVSDIGDLHLTFNNTDAIAMTFDDVHVGFSVSPTAYVYRWADVMSVNGDGLPLSGVDSTVMTMSGGDPIYHSADGVSTTPPQEVLEARGLTVADYMTTDTEGMAYIPLLTDTVDEAHPFGEALEGYLLDMSYQDTDGEWYNVTGTVLELDHYPMMGDDNSTTIVTIEAHYTDLVVEGDEVKLFTDYRTFGNVVIRDNATLFLDGCSMEVIQFSPEANGIYVMDSARLIMYNSSIESIQMIWLTIEGNGSLMAIDSTLSVGVRAFDGAEMFLDSTSTVAMEVDTTTAFTAVDSTIASLQMQGDSFGQFTNVSVSSLNITDSASIDHSRWLHMTVYDGSGVPIEGANIGLTEMDEGILWGEFVSNASGEVRVAVPSEAVDTMHGLSYDGKYQLNASFWYQGAEFVMIERDGTLLPWVDVLMPYSTLGSLTSGGMDVEIVMGEVLPDLGVNLTVDLPTPYRTRTVNITANVTNTGIIAANGITVRFFDGEDMLGDIVIDTLDSDSWVNATMPWNATYPLGDHNISVVVDPNDDIRELNESDDTDWTIVDVRGISELDVKNGDLTIDPYVLTVNDTATVTLHVYNNGDIDSPSFTVHFYDNDVLFTQRTVTSALAGSYSISSTSWTPTTPGQHVIKAVIDPDSSVEEVYEDNNEVNLTVQVNDYADLRAITVGLSQASPFVEVGDNTTLTVSVANDGQTAAYDVPVRFWLGTIGNGTLLDVASISSIQPGQTVSVQGSWVVTQQGGIYENVTIWAQVNPLGSGMTIETDRSDNDVSTVILMVDARPELSTTTLNITTDHEVIEAPSGQTVTISMGITNDGMRSAASVLVEVLFIQGDSVGTIATTHVDVIAGETTSLNTTWMVNGTVGDGRVRVLLNSDGAIDERGSNDTATMDFGVLDAVPEVSVDSGGLYQYDADTTINVMGSVVNHYSEEPLEGVFVLPVLEDMAGNRIAEGDNVTSSSTGRYISSIHIPSTASGDYVIKVLVVNGAEEATGDLDINVKAVSAGETSQPWWIWVIIFAIVGAIIVGFSYYLYRYGLGKMVECGECGAMIPEASKRCPNCGVEFETGTAKCSECGAWIPADSKRCPECGAVFLTEAIEEEEDEYIKSMRRQYEELLDGYREQARGEMGNKFSEPKFLAWWKKHPMYMTFEEWLSQEEDQRKSGSFACPSCGILNPKDAKVCHKCGTIFEESDLPNNGKRAVVRMGDISEGEQVVEESSESEPEPEAPTVEEPPEGKEESVEGSEEQTVEGAEADAEEPSETEEFDPAKKSTSLRRIVRKRKTKPPEGGTGE